jgi:serine/threonine-protein kinase RsbW
VTNTSVRDRPEEQDGQPAANSVTLRVANGPLAAPVLGRVIAMVLARAHCPVNRLDDAMILCDALSAHAPAHARDGHVAFTMATDARGIELRVGELAERGADGLLADADVPGVGNVLERLSDELLIEPSPSAEPTHPRTDELVLKLRFG